MPRLRRSLSDISSPLGPSLWINRLDRSRQRENCADVTKMDKIGKNDQNRDMVKDIEHIDDPTIVEAELHIPGILVQVGSCVWEQTGENTQTVDEYTIAMLLSAKHRLSQGYFEIEDNRRAFVDIGDFIMVPAGMPLRSRASGGPIRFVRCRYTPERFARLTGMADADWAPEILKHCLDIRDARLHQAMMRLGHEELGPGYNV